MEVLFVLLGNLGTNKLDLILHSFFFFLPLQYHFHIVIVINVIPCFINGVKRPGGADELTKINKQTSHVPLKQVTFTHMKE